MPQPSISEVARQVGLRSFAIRYYEQMGYSRLRCESAVSAVMTRRCSIASRSSSGRGRPGSRSMKACTAIGRALVMALVALGTPQYRTIILQVSCDRVERDFGGGPGGRPAPDAQCDSGFVAVGFHVQTGEYYNQAWLDCAPLR